MSPYVISIPVALMIGVIGFICVRIFKGYNFDLLQSLKYLVIVLFVVTGINELYSWGVMASKSSYRELLAYKLVAVHYYEPWNELITVVDTHTDSKGYTYTTTHTEVVYHGPSWEATDETGSTHGIDQSDYETYAHRWGGVYFTNLHRFYYTMDGNKYSSKWNGNFSDIYPYITVGHYENRVRASSSALHKWPKPTDSLRKRFKRPADLGTDAPLISYSSLKFTKFQIYQAQQENANLGLKYQVYPILVLFDGTKDVAYRAEEMMGAWDGPNMNELVTCVGIDPKDFHVIWCRVYSWMDNTYIYSVMQDAMLNCKYFSTDGYDRLIFNKVSELWHRKDFQKDFSYITIEMSGWGLFWMFFIDIVLNFLAVLIFSDFIHYREI